MIRIEAVTVPSGVETAALRMYYHWQHEPGAFWLDSGWESAGRGRFSFLGAAPCAVLTVRDGEMLYESCVEGEGRRRWSGDPWQALAEVTAPVFATPFPAGFPVPFAGGLVGYLAYDIGHLSSRLARRAAKDLTLPDMMFGLYDAVLCIDHLEETLYLVSTGLPRTGRDRIKGADERLAWLRREVAAAMGSGSPKRVDRLPPTRVSSPSWRRKLAGSDTPFSSTFTREAYLETVRRVLALIERGEVDQVNLAQRFSAPTSATGPELYRRLRKASPAPYAGSLRVGDGWILSSSPERFVHMRGDDIETRPIKGTRPRGRDAATDARHRNDLLSSVKDASEHNMIVEMERKTLERLCIPGSVGVPERMVCEEYKTVFHLVSTVRGRLEPHADRIECIRQMFPGGSITGRPKARAMALIDELEPVRRGPYTGSMGYFGVGGHVDLNVAIRTVVLYGGRAYFHVGGAIVAGSDPEDEYEETLDKAEGIVRALLASGR